MMHFFTLGMHHCDDDGPWVECLKNVLMLAYAPFMGSASHVSNAVTRSPSHESGATNQCYTIHTVSITHSPQNVSSDLQYTNHKSSRLIECNHQT